MRTKRKKIIIVALTLSCLAMILYFVPVPKRLNMNLEGHRITAPETEEPVHMSVRGWELKYLFRPNTLRGSMTLTILPTGSEEGIYEFSGDIFAPYGSNFMYASVAKYDIQDNQYEGASLYFDKEWKHVLIEQKDIGITLSTDEDIQPANILEYFEPILP